MPCFIYIVNMIANKIIFTVMTLCLYSYYSCGQTAEYNIMLNNKVIGNIITKKFTSNNQTTYTFKSTISTKIIMRIKVITENTSIYNQAHELISCKLKATQKNRLASKAT